MGKLLSPTALQRHAGFFDADGDGLVKFGETRAQLQALGLPAWAALSLSVLVNGFLGKMTQGRMTLDISLEFIHRGNHPFDTGLFDDRGDADPAAFEALFAASSTSEPRDRLTESELRSVIVARGDPDRTFEALPGLLSKLFSFLEVRVLLQLAADGHKRVGGTLVPSISRRMLRRFVEGRLFYLLARRRRIRLARGAG